MTAVAEPQPRERAVPCSGCGFTFDRSGLPVPRTMTWAVSGICDRCTEKREKAA